MVLVGYDQEQHHSFRDFDDCEELRYLTLLVALTQDKGTGTMATCPVLRQGDT